MSGILQEIASGTLTVLLGGLVGYLISLIKHGVGRDRAMDHGMQVLLRARLIDIHVKYVEHDEPCPVNVKEEADEVYEAYHSLGGNGTGTHLHDEIMDAHIASSCTPQGYGSSPYITDSNDMTSGKEPH